MFEDFRGDRMLIKLVDTICRKDSGTETLEADKFWSGVSGADLGQI